MDIELDVRWRIRRGTHEAVLEPVVFELLRGIRAGGHLNYAAQAAGVSYRHAWGLLRDWEERFGTPLVSARQGRGAQLTAFGEALLEIAGDSERALAPTLERVALETAARLTEAADPRRQPVAIVSSHSERMAALREHLRDRFRVTLDITGSENALHRYRHEAADIAGFHLPLGDLGRRVAAHLIGLLDGTRDRVWLLEERVLGLISRPAQPVRAIAQLAAGGTRFINRQPGSGTRLIFDGLLGEAGIAPGAVPGYGDEEFTHTAVAALVASGGADAGFGSAAAAAALDLAFEPLVPERFYLVMPRSADSGLRRAVSEFCAAQELPNRARMKDDEITPTVAVLKRVHRAGFWKRPPPA